MSQLPTLLVVDDKRNMTRLMAKVMKEDARVLTADSAAAALRLLSEEPVDVVLCDLQMPDQDGLDVLRACRRLRPGAEFVLMTAYATVATAVEALKLGAYDYLTKPFDPDDARSVLLRALGRAVRADSALPQASEVLPGVLASAPAMLDLADFVRKVADSDATALVLGETGTGKERVARALHELSPRAGARFVALNCAAVPAELLESELFGSARGAFTGATSDRKGLFEEADGGTLFLDEVGDLRPSLQAKLTRVLEERAVRRLGESKERPVDVRLVAATHCDLEAMVERGTFRQDLWYRLNVALVHIPPLRERRQDVELLARHFLKQQAERTARERATRFSRAALEALSAYDWPGNVRQLRSAVERACLVASGESLELGDLPPEVRAASGGSRGAAFWEGVSAPELSELTWSEALERGRAEAGRRYLEALLSRFGGQVSEAAAHAGVERESFYRLLRKHGIEVAAFR